MSQIFNRIRSTSFHFDFTSSHLSQSSKARIKKLLLKYNSIKLVKKKKNRRCFAKINLSKYAAYFMNLKEGTK